MDEINKYFVILGLNPDASLEEVESAYEKLTEIIFAPGYQDEKSQQIKETISYKELTEAYRKAKAFKTNPDAFIREFERKKEIAQQELIDEQKKQQESQRLRELKKEETSKIYVNKIQKEELLLILRYSFITSIIITLAVLFLKSLAKAGSCFFALSLIGDFALVFLPGILTVYLVYPDLNHIKGWSGAKTGLISGFISSCVALGISIPVLFLAGDLNFLLELTSVPNYLSATESGIIPVNYLTMILKLIMFSVLAISFTSIASAFSGWIASEVLYNLENKGESPVKERKRTFKKGEFVNLSGKDLIKYSAYAGVVSALGALGVNLFSSIPVVGCLSCFVGLLIPFLPGISGVFLINKSIGPIKKIDGVKVGALGSFIATSIVVFIEIPLAILIMFLVFKTFSYYDFNLASLTSNLPVGISIIIIAILASYVVGIVLNILSGFVTAFMMYKEQPETETITH